MKNEEEIVSIIYQIIGYVSMMEKVPGLKKMVKNIEILLDDANCTNSAEGDKS